MLHIIDMAYENEREKRKNVWIIQLLVNYKENKLIIKMKAGIFDSLNFHIAQIIFVK